MAAVFQFMKTLDPTSVVRESEFAQAAGAAGVLEKANASNLFEKFKKWCDSLRTRTVKQEKRL